MLDTLKHVKHYRDFAEECRRLAKGTLSGQMKSRYLLMAKDYTLLADVEEQSLYIEDSSAGAATIFSHFPISGPIIQTDFLSNDADGQERTRRLQAHDDDHYPHMASTSLAGALTRCVIMFRSIVRGLLVPQQISSKCANRSQRFGSQ